MSDYSPPENNNVVFNFTDSGYQKPSFDAVNFNFGQGDTPVTNSGTGNLSAVIQVVKHSPYKDEAYTYLKSCPKYIVGYSSSGIQIINGKCIYGGIRDLQASIICSFKSYTTADLAASLKILLFNNLSSSMGVHNPVDIGASLKVFDQSDLLSYLQGFTYTELKAILSGTHDPLDLYGFISGFSQSVSVLNSHIHVWHTKGILANIKALKPYYLNAFVNPIPAVDLIAYLKVWPQNILKSSIKGWGFKNLTANISQIYDKYLQSYINSVSDTISDLSLYLKGIGKGIFNLSANTVGFNYDSINANIRATYFNNITAYLFPVVPKYIKANIFGWDVSNLLSSINITEYPWNLTAYINSSGSKKYLYAHIIPVSGTSIVANLISYINSWRLHDLNSIIFGEFPSLLTAYINPMGMASDLHASIVPKIIRLTTIVKIPTMTSSDLTSTINYPCFKTNYKDLKSSLYANYKKDLSSYIRPISIYKENSLSAKIGYSDSYSEVDKLKLSITVYPSNYFVEDKYNISFNILKLGTFLNAYIKCIPTSKNLTANIFGNKRNSFYYNEVFKNREKIINKTYDGVFKSFEVVEMAFKNVVKDYYYSSDGNYAWKSNRFDKWMLDVKSYIPANVSLNIKRKLHKATTLYDLRKFSSIDEAVRYAMSYVTEYPSSNLSAYIAHRGATINLSAILSPMYNKKSMTNITANINVKSNKIIVNSNNNILTF